MRINLNVELTDGTKTEVVCTAADLVKFEEKFNISVAKLEQEQKLTHLFFLAYASMSRQKKTALSFEEWMDTIETIGAGETDPK
jgi:hypothetical protein